MRGERWWDGAMLTVRGGEGLNTPGPRPLSTLGLEKRALASCQTAGGPPCPLEKQDPGSASLLV